MREGRKGGKKTCTPCTYTYHMALDMYMYSVGDAIVRA